MKIQKGLSAYTLQLIAVVAMFIDHLAHIVVNMDFAGSMNVVVAMNCIGRITMPIMCFFIAEGYHKTSNLPRYMLRLVVLAVIAQIPYYLFGLDSIPQSFWGFVKGNILHMNVAVTLLMGLIALSVVKNDKFNLFTKVAVAIAAISLTRFSDWRYYGVMWILMFGIFHGDFVKQAVFFTIVTALRCWHYSGDLYQIMMNSCVILAILLLYFYNGEKGKKPKYGFYVFYPVHLLILGIIRILIIT